MKKLAVFDLDGTLLDTIGDLAAASNHALAQMGFPQHPVDRYKQFVGNGLYCLIERMAPEQYRDQPEVLAALKQAFDSYYHTHSNEQTKPYDGMIDLLHALQQKGICLAVLTNKPHMFAQQLCAHYFSGYFSLVIGHREGYAHKPAPELMDEILQKTGMQAQDCIFIGDSGVDMQTAANSHIFGVGVLWGFRGRDELIANGADAIVQEPMQIMKYLDD